MKPSSGPQATNIGNLESSARLKTERSVGGQPSGAPNGDCDQSRDSVSSLTGTTVRGADLIIFSPASTGSQLPVRAKRPHTISKLNQVKRDPERTQTWKTGPRCMRDPCGREFTKPGPRLGLPLHRARS